jgi:glycine betaine/proline transport system substrate-binding protein
LKKRQIATEEFNKLLAWMVDNQATGEDGAKYYLKNNEATWSTWVSPEAAEKIKAAVQ